MKPNSPLTPVHGAPVEGPVGLVVEGDSELELKGAAVIGGVQRQVLDLEDAEAVAWGGGFEVGG
jgi:hypothetical protein